MSPPEYLFNYYPPLPPSFLSSSRFPWLQKLEENAAVVQQELKEALQMGEMLEKTGNNVWIGASTSEGAAYGPDWKTLVLQVCPFFPPSFSSSLSSPRKRMRVLTHLLFIPSLPPSP